MPHAAAALGEGAEIRARRSRRRDGPASERRLGRLAAGPFGRRAKRARGRHLLRATKKAAEAAFLTGAACRPSFAPCGLLAQVGELVAELLDAAAQAVDALLRAGVERVRLAGGFQLEQRQLAAVFHLETD